MDDNDNLYFSFDEEEEAEEAGAEEAQNRTFLIGAIVLAAVFVLGICAIVIFFVLKPGQRGEQVSEIELTNQANMTLAAATQTAAFQTQLAPTQPPAEETEEPGGVVVEPSPTATPTSLVAVTPVEGEETAQPTPEEGTAVAEVTAEATSEGPPTPTPRVQGGETPSSGIIEVTPLGGGDETPEPTGVGGPIAPSGATATTGAGGPIQPTAVATLPTTGFAGTFGLAGAGLLALALVAVIFVIRRVRLQ